MITAGSAYVRADRVGAATVLTHARANSPLRILTPRTSSTTSWVVTSTFGGGLLGGDCVSLTLDVQPNARVLLTSQASTKVYRPSTNARGVPSQVEGRSTAVTQQHLHVRIGDDAMLAVLPDPIVAFAEARFEQRQRFELTGRGSLVALDWMTSGRHARGEHWEFDRYSSRIEIAHEGREIFYDHLSLTAADGPLVDRMRRFTTYLLLVIAGPIVRDVTTRVIEAVDSMPVSAAVDPIMAVAPIAGGFGAAIRVAARDVERASDALRDMLHPLIPMLGDDPWARRGTPLCI